MDSTAVIRTIGRSSLNSAISSCLRERLKVIVVADGVDIFQSIKSVNVQYIKTGRKWGHYGHMGINVAAALATTEFITIVDDDDELAEGAGSILRECIKDPKIDIWIPTLEFNNGMQLCNKGPVLAPGNVAVPTYRTEIFYTVPQSLALIKNQNEDYFDYFHIQECAKYNYTVDWINKPIYKVRPKLTGTNGRGK